MRASLYEALGIPPTASDEEVRAALRRLIRKYYAKTRDGQGNVEEALRFINHASRILSDPDRRARYNGELARSGRHGIGARSRTSRSTRWRRPAKAPTSREPSPIRRRSASPLAAEADAGDNLRNVHHPGLTEPVASFGRPDDRDRSRCACCSAAFIAAAIVLVMPARHRGGREAGAGLAHADAARADGRLRHRPRLRLGAAPRRQRRRTA